MVERAARNAATRARIADAALAQIADAGYASASVTAVAARAGVAAGSVYTYFPSKADLFTEVFDDANAGELANVAEIAERTETSVPERLNNAVSSWAHRALIQPTLAWALMAEPVDPALEQRRQTAKRGYRDVFARLLEEGVLRGELEPVDSLTCAAAIVGAMQEALLGPLARRTQDTDAVVASLASFVLHAVQAKEPDAWPSPHTAARTRPTRS